MDQEEAVTLPVDLTDPLPPVPEPVPFKRKRGRPRKGEVRPVDPNARPPVPPPANRRKAEAIARKLVADSVASIVAEKEAPLVGVGVKAYDRMSKRVRAQIMSLLGPDIDAARSLFADEMLATARLLVQRIVKDVDTLPASTLAFTMSCLVDKSEALRNKQASSASGAKVAIQINNYGDGAIDRKQLMAELHPEVAAPIDVNKG